MPAPLRKLPDIRFGDFPFFSGISASAVDSAIRDLPVQSYARGEFIIRQGETAAQAYLVFDGKIAITVDSRRGSHSIAFRAAPDIAGIIEIHRERPYLASVIAVEPSSALILDRKDFIKMLHANHQIAVNLVHYLSELLYQTGRDRDVRLFGNVEHLLANTICYFAALYGEAHEYGILIRREINKSELANLLGIARRSVIRGLESLAAEHLIRLDGKQLVIPNLKALSEKARESTSEATSVFE